MIRHSLRTQATGRETRRRRTDSEKGRKGEEVLTLLINQDHQSQAQSVLPTELGFPL